MKKTIKTILSLMLCAAMLAGTLLFAASFIDFRYIRCPHCGKKLITRNSHWYPNGMCPSCGKHVDENTIID